MKNLQKFSLFEARLSRTAMFSPEFLSNFKNLSFLIHECCVGEINKIGGDVTIDYLENEGSPLIVIKVSGAEDIVIGIMSITEPTRRWKFFDSEWETAAEIASDDLVGGLESDSESIHRCLNSISPGFSTGPGEYVNKLAAKLFSYPIGFIDEGQRWPDQNTLANLVKTKLEGVWPDLEGMQKFITNRWNVTASRDNRNRKSILDGICESFFKNYLEEIFRLIYSAKLHQAKTDRVTTELNIDDLFKTDLWRELESLGWTNATTEKMRKNKSLSLQNVDIGLYGGDTGSISIVNTGYIRKSFPGGSGNIVLKKFSPFSKLEDYFQAFEYVKEYTLRKILADAGIKTGPKKLNYIEDVASYLIELYKNGDVETISKAWDALPQNVKNLAVKMSGDPDFERSVKAFSSFRRRII